ncbi:MULTISPECIES: cytochrome ubiquinol oxidase subunit I [unclassified Bradyrhizobium]|uniref:cytochrome ubiquinol oxidase subunit I n=1 Tax=unclassified Bradyrhizobium TaxID=2631580 RepID=UPI0028ED80EE|nr:MULTISPECIES: cytochrome ubiquinol oxidase subunit I [unclassified Bradyrhizobium]
MDLTPLILSRIQFAFTISYHIVFPSFTIGLAAWLALLEGLNLGTGRPVYRRLFDFWLRIFAVAFGLGVVSGIVMAFEFGTNWSQLSLASGPIQGPLLAYESFTAFALEASFFGVLMFGRPRLPPSLYFISVVMVALGTTFSAFWIMVNNSWMQAPSGYAVQNGLYVPIDWAAIIFNRVVWVRFPHMLLAAYLTGAFCVAATGAWFRLGRVYAVEGKTMLAMGLYLAAVLIPIQLLFGHFNGDYVHDLQPAKFAAIEARWHDEQPAGEVVIALPDESRETNHYELKIPVLGSLIATMTTDSKEIGLTSFARSDRPPVAIPFFAFRIMVGCGLLMMAVAWFGSLLMVLDRLDMNRRLLWTIFCCFPLPFVAILTGWFTAEVGRQPWTVYGVLRTADAVTPTLTSPQAVASLAFFVCVHALIFGFGTFFIYRLLRAGPVAKPFAAVNPKRPLAFAAGGPVSSADLPERGSRS